MCVFCVAFHLTKFVENFLSVARSVRGDCAGVLCVFEANVVDVAICFAANYVIVQALYPILLAVSLQVQTISSP